MPSSNMFGYKFRRLSTTITTAATTTANAKTAAVETISTSLVPSAMMDSQSPVVGNS